MENLKMRTIFAEAWTEVRSAYRQSRVNSERTLQAVLYMALTKRLHASQLAICEPTIELEKVGECIPDLMVLNGTQVVAVAELKFVPHFYPAYKADLEKLRAYGIAKDRFQLLIDPRSGCFNTEHYSFASDCLLGFVVIGRSDSEAVDEVALRNRMRGLEDRFLPLIHVVSDDVLSQA